MNKQICPACNGSKLNDGFHFGKCLICDGRGEVNKARAESYALGQTLREFRTIRNVMMRECADKYGIEVMDWLQLENGATHPRKIQAAFDWIQDAELQIGFVPSVKEQV